MKEGINILDVIKGQMRAIVNIYGCNNDEYRTLRNLFNEVTTKEEQNEFYEELGMILNKHNEI